LLVVVAVVADVVVVVIVVLEFEVVASILEVSPRSKDPMRIDPCASIHKKEILRDSFIFISSHFLFFNKISKTYVI